MGNTVTTGSVTIPMMKKTGYKPEFAGAVEAASSTGGQIMPPIMGAAAFLMAEYMGIPYIEVAAMAIVPALLYFTGIFCAGHLEAKKLGLKGVPREELPSLGYLAKNCYLVLPLVLLGTLWAFRWGRKWFPYHNMPMLFAAQETGMLGIPLFIMLFGADQWPGGQNLMCTKQETTAISCQKTVTIMKCCSWLEHCIGW